MGFWKRYDALKVSINYVAISRFIMAVSAVLLTGLFLITEEYAFAVCRAVVFQLCFLAFSLIFPMRKASGIISDRDCPIAQHRLYS